MEPVAVNRFVITEELFAESHDAVFSERRRKMLLYGGIVFLVFGFGMLLAQIRLKAMPFLCVPTLATGLFVTLRAVTLKKSDFKKQYRAFRKRSGSAEREIVCHSRYLSVEAGGDEPVLIDYPDIVEHRETPHLLLLLCSDRTGVLLAKDGFVSGSKEALLEAIEKAKAEAETLM